jgi:pyruvate formate lyase activating enzyme
VINKQGTIFNIQSFSVHDGPGIRTTVFFKGCNLRCYWCHNPESWNPKPELQLQAGKCIGCGACIEVCPFAGNDKLALFSTECIQCGKCAEACYSGAVSFIGKSVSVEELLSVLLRDKDVYAASKISTTSSDTIAESTMFFITES